MDTQDNDNKSTTAYPVTQNDAIRETLKGFFSAYPNLQTEEEMEKNFLEMLTSMLNQINYYYRRYRKKL